jgi:hypothetical protein
VDEQIARTERMVFEGLQGSTAGLRLVVDESLINEFIADNLTARYPSLNDVQLAIAAHNQIAVRVRSKAVLIPDLTLHLEIDRVVTLDPLAVRFRIRKQGLSQVVAWVLPAIADTLPAYVKLSGENVVVEFATLLEQWRSMLPLLEKLEIQTSPRKLHVAMDLRASSRMPASSHGGPATLQNAASSIRRPVKPRGQRNPSPSESNPAAQPASLDRFNFRSG